MARLEKQIVAGALALVAILLAVVIYRGIDGGPEPAPGTETKRAGLWSDPGDSKGTPALSLSLMDSVPQAGGESGESSAAERRAEDVGSSDPGAAPSPAAPGVARALELDLDPNWDREMRAYEVVDGDTLGEIALRELGSVSHVDEILKLNETLRPEQLQVGQTIWLPSREQLTAVRPEPEQPESGTRSENPVGEAASEGRFHEVVAGDSLWKIAERYYGAGAEKGRIFQANRSLLRSEDAVLRIGMRLRIPE